MNGDWSSSKTLLWWNLHALDVSAISQYRFGAVKHAKIGFGAENVIKEAVKSIHITRLKLTRNT